MNKVSEHITWADSVRSTSAQTAGIFNAFTPAQLTRMKLLASKVYEPLCAHFKVVIPFNSFFRNAKVNKMVGGSPTSQHMANDGAAIDLDADKLVDTLNNEQLFNYIKDHMEFDQLIKENGWVHVSYREKNNRKQVIYN